MKAQFFELATPRDMYSKAQREFDRMKTELNTDTIFNFFVTTYHIMDYVKTQTRISANSLQQMYDDPDFEMCQFICNKGKHLVLRKEDLDTKAIRGGSFGRARFGRVRFGRLARTRFFVDKKEMDIVALGERLMAKWQNFLTANAL